MKLLTIGVSIAVINVRFIVARGLVGKRMSTSIVTIEATRVIVVVIVFQVVFR